MMSVHASHRIKMETSNIKAQCEMANQLNHTILWFSMARYIRSSEKIE